MKRKAFALTLVMALLFSLLFHSMLVQSVESQSVETIFIKADCSVEGTDKIQRNENVYTLRATFQAAFRFRGVSL